MGNDAESSGDFGKRNAALLFDFCCKYSKVTLYLMRGMFYCICNKITIGSW